MGLGGLMIDVLGAELDSEDRELLAHPGVGGVVLFTRNYVSPAQLIRLSSEIRSIKEPPLLIAVDQEGGRVQRFVEGFGSLPAAARFGAEYDRDRARALRAVGELGWLIGSQLGSVGVDFSFAPVLDRRDPRSQVIGDRAFHSDADTISALGHAFMRGLGEAGVRAVGKHFPGHGSVLEDSHRSTPVDRRDLDSIVHSDLVPFHRLIEAGLPGIMSAHVRYPGVDERPATYSSVWLDTILRRRLGFTGIVFSDDLSMAGARGEGIVTVADRARAAQTAGCDMMLICNDRPGAIQAIEAVALRELDGRLARMRAVRYVGWPELCSSSRYQAAQEILRRLG